MSRAEKQAEIIEYKEVSMRLSPPKKLTFWASVVLALVALVANFVPFLSPFAVWIALVAFVVLALGNLVDGF